MRCIFCKLPSDGAPVEHIIPESLGNTRHVLPRGMVCDKCNNYFARKVEGPLLAHSSFRNLRAWNGIPNKRGRKPDLYGFVAGTDIDVGLAVGTEGVCLKTEKEGDVRRLKERIERSNAANTAEVFLFTMDIDPPKREMSRLLAKMASEAVALRFSYDASFLNQFIDDPHFDRIRNWARRGDNFDSWPYYQRQIFPEETLMRHPITKDWVQAGFGYDLFFNRRTEMYFAFCLYGYEFVINVGGPSTKGHEEWLRDNQHMSPLVERIGLKLKRFGRTFRLEGDSYVVTGMNFDRRQCPAFFEAL